MRSTIIRSAAVVMFVGLAGVGGASIVSADTVVQPGSETGAYCSVVSEDGSVSHLNTPSQCLQARIAARMEEQRLLDEQDRKNRAEDRRAALADRH